MGSLLDLARSMDRTPGATLAEARPATKEIKATEVTVPSLACPGLEVRRAKVEGRLLADKTLRVAFDVENVPLVAGPGEPVSVLLAVRTAQGVVSGALQIPRERWDPVLFAQTLEQTAERPQ